MVKHGKLTFEYSKITPYIYIGTNQCCTMHFKSSLLRKGIKADLSAEKEKLDAPFGVDYFLWIPVKDHTAPSLKQFIIGSSFINHCVRNRLPVYVHCQRGHGRAPTMVAAYLIVAKKLSPEKAVEHIRKKRKAVHPNKRQIAALKRFSKYIAKKGKSI